MQQVHATAATEIAAARLQRPLVMKDSWGKEIIATKWLEKEGFSFAPDVSTAAC